MFRTLGDRNTTIDEVNRAIDKLCNENDINIAFNQLEVYLHNKQGEEVQEIKKALLMVQHLKRIRHLIK